ncbi:hypothetical protein GCM10009093_08330 [Brevundimonas terrae]|uniref:Peptidase S8/S53 domain-containing protein n=1 Tax=Brevundimonas terrae TaxID=363631 RepID=A0ABP3HXF8_9CAUL|nr:hypothetical protein [Brevundimonas terrae]
MPDVNSREYTRNWGIADAKAISAWQTGATGRGVSVAVIDSGMTANHPDLGINVSAASTDIVMGRNTLESPDRHGTRVASVIAAPHNGRGTIGVAHESTILAIRADVSECTKPEDDVCFKSSDLARALDYAVANGARIINMSLGGESSMGFTFEQALLRAVNAGAIIAISSGNEGEVNPSWPGRYATDPRFAGSIIVVGSHGVTGGMSSFSNRAGVNQTAYISAPGEKIIADCGDTSCWEISGTSFSSPAVAGAMALLKQAFPNLSGREIVDILLTSATDAGDTGTDIVWGRGKLDIERAFQPIGRTSSPSATSATAIGLDVPPGTYAGAAFGDAISRTDSLGTIAYDQYSRLFTVNLAGSYRAAPRRSFQPDLAPPTVQTRVTALGPAGSTLSLSAAQPMLEPEPLLPRHDLYSAPWLGTETRREAMVAIDTPHVSFAAWQGEGGARSPFRTGAGDGFTALAQANHAVRGSLNFQDETLGHFNVTAESGGGDRRAPLQSVERDAAKYARFGLDWRKGAGGLSFSLGQLDERMGPLGAYMPTSSDLALPANTTFAAIGGNWQMANGLAFVAEGGIGSTAIDGRFMSLEDKAISSNWRLQMLALCPFELLGCQQLSWQISQPLRVESGTFSATLADTPLDYFDPVTFSVRRFSASPSGRQIDFSMRSIHALSDGATLQFEATAIRNEQHQRDAKPGYAFLAHWRRAF